MRRYEHVVNTKLLILSYYVMLFIWRAHWRETKRHLEIETLRTQRFVKTASNKRLRAEIENEATSSQSSSQQSQSSYEPNTDTSEDEIDDLKPTWNIGDFDISAVLAGFRRHSLSLHHQFLPLSHRFPPVHLELLSDFNLNEYFYQISNKEHELINDVYYKLATNENGHAEEIVLEHMGNDNLRVCCKVLYNLLQTYTRKVNLQAVDESMYITLSINPFIDVFFDYNYRNVVSFLIHTGFEPELRFQLYKHKITIRDDFDPLSPTIIRDPTLLNESIERKTKLARHVFLQRLGSAFRRLKAPLYNAVTNYFLQSGLIDLNFLESFDLAPPYSHHNPLLDKI
ncbi:hypothetical protein G6F50_006183 [Rhizopus delemar]|uniref:Uncharacterized protein n=1 Tax=Rhizopus delemar TaxID=936053 RepID=A0A9P6Z355_9FUNG|nr:hypothetical protein G6F50_006183 [Rhizopus delemar]